MKAYAVRSLVALLVLAAGGVAACAGGDAASSSIDASGSDSALSSPDALASVDASNDVPSASPDASGAAADAACVLSETDAGTCNAIDVVGTMVAATCSMSAPPQALAGAIEDGIYVLDSFTYYGVCPTAPDVASTTWQICGNHWDVLQVLTNSADGGTFPPERLNFVTNVQASSVEYTESCGGTVSVGPRGYSATPGHLTFIYPDATTPGRTFVSTFTKQ